MFIDESGSKHSAGGFFVLGMVKVRDTASFFRGLRDLRSKHRMHREMKFSQINRGCLAFYFDVAEYLAASDVRIGASVYDSDYGFAPGEATWRVQANMTSRLVVANVNREGEAVNVFLDLVQTPKGFSVAEGVRNGTRGKLGSPCVIEVYDLDSQATDGLQVADFVASAISYERQHGRGGTSYKAQVAARLRRAFALDTFDDVREGKVNILTMRHDPTFTRYRPRKTKT